MAVSYIAVQQEASLKGPSNGASSDDAVYNITREGHVRATQMVPDLARPPQESLHCDTRTSPPEVATHGAVGQTSIRMARRRIVFRTLFQMPALMKGILVRTTRLAQHGGRVRHALDRREIGLADAKRTESATTAGVSGGACLAKARDTPAGEVAMLHWHRGPLDAIYDALKVETRGDRLTTQQKNVPLGNMHTLFHASRNESTWESWWAIVMEVSSGQMKGGGSLREAAHHGSRGLA